MPSSSATASPRTWSAPSPKLLRSRGYPHRAKGRTFEEPSRLDPDRFAAHGGAFPVRLRGTGVVGVVAVSGLPQADDHALVVEGLERFLAAG